MTRCPVLLQGPVPSFLGPAGTAPGPRRASPARSVAAIPFWAGHEATDDAGPRDRRQAPASGLPITEIAHRPVAVDLLKQVRRTDNLADQLVESAHRLLPVAAGEIELGLEVIGQRVRLTTLGRSWSSVFWASARSPSSICSLPNAQSRSLCRDAFSSPRFRQAIAALRWLVRSSVWARMEYPIARFGSSSMAR